MLQKLSIKNYALIDKIEIDFTNGFTAVTGETGSGKSILLGALGLILGERADLKSLRNKDEKCVIEGVFKLGKKKFSSFFYLNDIDFEEETILRREITPSGKSRAFINDTPVKLTTLKELGERLIDIHSQHQTQQVNTIGFQSLVLDIASNSSAVFEAYKAALKSYEVILNQIKENEALQQKAVAEQDYINFQLEELSAIDLDQDKELVEQEYNLLANAEDVISISNEVSNIINNEQGGVIEVLQQLEQALSKLERVDDSYQELMARVKSTIIELQDVDFEVSNKLNNLEMDEERLVYLDELLGEFNRLEKKYNVFGLSDLKQLKEELEEKAVQFNSLDNTLEKLYQKAKESKQEVLSVGSKLTGLREKGAVVLEKRIKKILNDLSMPNAIFKVVLSKLEEPSNYGIESIDFQIATNKGSNFDSLKKVASGGELSRVMLAIKTILAEKGMLPTLIFDEIDTGVSGVVASKMGGMMQEMGKKLQVISITHLPQVASKGGSHLKVYKEDKKDQTHTFIVQLNNDERLVEIAKMLSGANPTEAAISNAKELLN